MNTGTDLAAAVPFSGAALVGIQLEALGLATTAPLPCDYAAYAADQCQSRLFPIYDATLVAGVLSYTVSYDSDEVKITISDSQYSSGSYQRTESDGHVQNMNWSRDSDGTERFNANSNDGASSKFVEFPDCSGKAARVFHPVHYFHPAVIKDPS